MEVLVWKKRYKNSLLSSQNSTRMIQQQIKEYIKEIHMEKFTSEQSDILYQTVTIQEISHDIKKMKKDIGVPDGFTAMYYKYLGKKIILLLIQKVTNEISKEKTHKALIYKEGNDPAFLQSYRSTSLLNLDYKLFTSITLEKLRKCITELIHIDQTSFVPKGFMKIMYIL